MVRAVSPAKRICVLDADHRFGVFDRINRQSAKFTHENSFGIHTLLFSFTP
jgi:RecG-like helicase